MYKFQLNMFFNKEDFLGTDDYNNDNHDKTIPRLYGIAEQTEYTAISGSESVNQVVSERRNII